MWKIVFFSRGWTRKKRFCNQPTPHATRHTPYAKHGDSFFYLTTGGPRIGDQWSRQVERPLKCCGDLERHKRTTRKKQAESNHQTKRNEQNECDEQEKRGTEQDQRSQWWELKRKMRYSCHPGWFGTNGVIRGGSGQMGPSGVDRDNWGHSELTGRMFTSWATARETFSPFVPFHPGCPDLRKIVQNHVYARYCWGVEMPNCVRK